MNREQAKELIRRTFESPFNKEKFIVFIKNLLNKIEEKPFTYQGNYIPDAFKPYISKLERIGKYSDGENEIDLLIVRLKRESSLERARTMQRNFIAWYLKGSRGGELKDAALVAFVSPDKEDWRFSLVKMDYRFEEGQSGKIKAKEEFTPARRWSFLVGKNEKSHTAQSTLVPILEDDEYNPTLAQLEEAFNIEPVTKEFFDKYRDLLIRTVDALDKIVKRDQIVRKDFESKNINTVDFAKKLLGQIVFLYFLQKKGWFGVAQDKKWGEGDKNFIRNLFEKCKKEGRNFFNDYLKVLFYNTLNNPRTDQADPTWSKDFNCKIPFLNGGLFEPIGGYDWVHADIILPDGLFSNNRRSPEGDIGDGILDVFDRFNFTVKEDEPLEKEVAIDPELLGKLYEKFNAIRPDNFYEYKKALASGKKSLEKQFNKKFGVYYTPREIVHYMCQQSLIYYLSAELEGKVSKEDIEKLIKFGDQVTENEATALIKERLIKEGKQKTSDYELKLSESIRKNAKLIDDKLRNIKVCDPAIGSGAFPVGMMHEIVKTRNVLSAFINESGRSTYNFKRECIENSLYGVDIDAGACEVAKLRLWLSLIVDEEDISQIKPLPNLDYKIMQGNSLISEFLGINFDVDEERQSGHLIFQDKIDSLIKQFQEKKIDFLNEPDRNKKEQLREEIENLIINIFEEKLRKQKSNYFSQLKSIEEKYSALPNGEERNRYIAEGKKKLYKRTGFNLEQIEKQLKEYTSGRKTRPFFPWKLYFAEVFHQKGGFDVVIANPPYVEHKKLKGISSELKKSYSTYSGTADLYVYFYEKGLIILKDKGTLVFITSNKFIKTRYGEKLRRYLLDFQINEIIDFTKIHIFEALVASCILSISKINNSYNKITITFANDSLLDFSGVAEFVDKNSFYLNQNTLSEKIWQLKTDAKLALKEKIEKESIRIKEIDAINIYRGVTTGYNPAFIIDNEQRKKLIKEDKTAIHVIKPLLQGRNIRKWSYTKSNEFLIFTRRGIKINSFPSIKKYLQNFKDELEPGVGRKPGSYKWYEIQDNTAYYPEFEKEKIVWGLTADKWAFAYDNQGHYLPSNGYILTSREVSIKYLLALMNSRLMEFYFDFIGIMTAGGAFTLKRETIAEFPIKLTDKKRQEGFVELVNKILSITQSEYYLDNPQKQAKVKEYEYQIDQLVYKLYGLTKDEIRIIDKSIYIKEE